METQLGVGLPGFPGAQDIYSQGSFSKSIGVFTLTDGSPISIEAKTKVSGLTDSGAVVVGTATSAINENGPILSLQYSTTDEAGTTCNVGGSKSMPVTSKSSDVLMITNSYLFCFPHRPRARL